MSIDPTTARALGQLMCDTTREILWSPASAWVQSRKPASSLRCRVGAGQATYHRYDPHRHQHQITYGLRMIIAKHQADTAVGWLSGRELHRHQYFQGQVTTLNLLAHTCCHEFAHLLQYVAGKRYPGSVHNRDFYQILDELHASGGAEAVRNHLEQAARRLQLVIPDIPFQPVNDAELRANWQVGDAVSFGCGTRHHQGEILRVNRKTCTVEGTGHSRGLRYRVPLPLLRQRPD